MCTCQSTAASTHFSTPVASTPLGVFDTSDTLQVRTLLTSGGGNCRSASLRHAGARLSTAMARRATYSCMTALCSPASPPLNSVSVPVLPPPHQPRRSASLAVTFNQTALQQPVRSAETVKPTSAPHLYGLAHSRDALRALPRPPPRTALLHARSFRTHLLALTSPHSTTRCTGTLLQVHRCQCSSPCSLL